ncbi:MAG: gliding motility lipoprotein GldH [Bacteroidota bacterium]|nr:gliding motility lipoprotein GldH [Bacteroidota bacterium]
MIKKIFILGISILFLFSCNNKHFYEEYTEIPNNIWSQNEVVKFSVDIEDTSSLYNIAVNIRHGYYYQNKNLWLYIKTTSPSGKIQLDTMNCLLAEADNKWKGKCLSDLCDLLVPFADSIYLKEKGTYTFEFQHGLRQKKVASIVEIGLIIDLLGQK